MGNGNGERGMVGVLAPRTRASLDSDSIWFQVPTRDRQLQRGTPMIDALEAPDALDRDKALVLSALAATAWCARGGDSALEGKRLIERMMHAASWVSRARRHHRLPALIVAELVERLSEPVGTWLPSAGSLVLVKDGQPTPLCEDLADDAGGSPLAEVEQKVIRAAMSHIRGRDDEAATYTAFRRFLVEHAAVDYAVAAEALFPVGLELARVYEAVPTTARLRAHGREVFYPCPRCGWPMQVQDMSVSCHRSPTCLAAGAQFALREERLVGLGSLTAPTPASTDNVVALRPGIWRFTVLPGLEELALERLLGRIDGVEVELWPFVDAYDLDVRRGTHRWRIDLKDHSSVNSLARHLNENPVTEPTWIVVPSARREQVPRLQRLVDPGFGYLFADVGEIIRRVKGAK